MRVLITTDLDRTLIFSRRAIAELGGALPARTVDQTETTEAELAETAVDLLADLGRRVLLVPATTRTPAQLARIQLDGLSRFAIAANGAILLVDGQPDPTWSPPPRDAGSLIEARRILAEIDEVAVVRRRDVDGRFLYAVTESSADAKRLAALASERCAAINWCTTTSGRKLYLVPREINKASAVVHLRERLEADRGEGIVHLAAGDNGLDTEMLNLADDAWVPRGSDLANTTPETAWQITAQPGHQAAVEICRAWASAIDEALPVTTSRPANPRNRRFR